MSPPSWLPDWRRAELYLDPEVTPLHRWPWQFLRRNPEYQRLWDEHVRPFYCDADRSFDDTAAMEWAERRAQSDPEFERFLAGEGKQQYKITSPIRVVEEQFGIVGPPPPPRYDDVRLMLKHDFVNMITPGSCRHMLPAAASELLASLAPGEMLVRFNLAWPIGPQLERARRCLEGRAAFLEERGELQRIKKRNHVKHWRDYLRLLDAEATGTTAAEMAQVIFPKAENQYPDYEGSRRVGDALDTARRLRDGDYRFIGMTPQK